MGEGEIPVNARDLPISAPVMEDDRVYMVELRKFTVSPKLSVKGVLFGAIQCYVPEGDYEGMTISMNYLPLPIYLTADATKGQKTQAQINNAPFGRFANAFKVDGAAPSVTLSDADSIQRFMEWIERAYGNTGKVTIQNQEWQGNMRSSIRDFVIA